MPLDIPDQTIATKIQTPDMFRTIGNILNIRQGQQALQQGAVNLEQSQRTLEPNVAAAQSRAALAGTQANVAAQTAQPTIDQAEAAANLAKFKLTGEYAQKARDISQSLVSDPDIVSGNSEGMIPKIVAAKQTMIESGVPPSVAEVQAAHLIQAAAANPKGVRQMLLNSIQAGVGSGGQAQNVQPSGPAVGNGQVTQVVNTNPFSGVGVGNPVPGTTQQQQLPPTTPVFNPQTKAPGFLGPQPNGTVPVQSGPALGQAENAAGVASSAVQDWNTVQTVAKNAAQDIGVLQEIKKYAPGAVTGVETDRRAYLSGLAGLIGMTAEQLQKTDTDLLAKNSNMLALAGGDTNLAKTLAETANPNVHMTPQAIQKAANQVIGQRQMALARQQHLLPYINDPQAYNEQKTKFDQVADPRILQLPYLSDQEKIEMKKAMSSKEQADFSAKIRAMQSMGLLK